MKLIECTIENFGCLHRQTISFAPGLHVLREDNGFGKSTLAAFIKAMFYGFPRGSRGQLSKNERKKYAPWQGGKFGGSLTFETQGERYKITRYFGPTAAKDSFQLQMADTGMVSTRFGPDVGQELFGVDGESFSRSTYLPQLREEGFATADIQTRLTELVHDTDDMHGFEGAMRILQTQRTALRHLRGEGGAVWETERQLHERGRELDQLEGQRQAYLELNEQLQALEAQRQEETIRLEQLRQRISVAAAQSEQRQLRRTADREEQTLDHLRQAYPGGFPEEETIRQQRKALDRWRVLHAQLEETEESGPVPEEAALADAEQRAAALSSGTARLEELRLSPENQIAWEELQTFFRPGVPEEEELDRWEGLLRERHGEHPTKRAGRGPLALGLTALAVGLVLLICRQPLFGALCLGLGVALAAGGCGALLRWSRQEQARRQQKEASEQELRAAFARYFPDQSFRETFVTTLRQKKTALGMLQEQRDQLKSRYWALKKQNEGLKEELDAFLCRWGLYGTAYEQALGNLRQRLRNQQNRQDLLERLREPEQTLRDFLASYGLDTLPFGDALEQLDRDRREYDGALARGCAAREALAQQGGKLETEEPEELETLRRWERETVQKLRSMEEPLLELRQRQKLLQQQMDRIPALGYECDRLRQELAAQRSRCGLLDETMALLEQARQNLSDNYLGPMKQRFSEYAGTLLGEIPGEPEVGDQLSPELHAGGQSRGLEWFSAGTADCLEICMHLALTDALFPGEKPCLILDDPFVNLDDKNLSRGLDLLKKLARERQILYLTCSDSRCVREI